ncbi:MAG: UDP-N-acetylglucosamine 2-epimerase (non-hydrolyzing) [Gemmatimonadaceae bacterium]|nr:UDP-N-acetylglucosamine 2-epimerase (non-hydrolyzing) [Gemmatimonadaceae bacterium]NUQ93634.1 UDP-N-acetylglucosamine 2-epimerase (non-hydrolyzing) [Gemmatimonadaceae bacterium]NUR17929.1 UDP-N-acetylglucosamine 2-epimerase (non-hydrolyzing) [Gemmatimonadaceae bacterium]NUS98962.1 UDP-N-acetylglucosamine 2-epimerase (non-hydrolyzing) [Gemmatimonadaceae bacterium]
MTLDEQQQSARRVLTIIGTRPEGIKLAPVVRALARRAPRLESRVAITGQHSQMLDQVIDRFGIGRDYDLRIMRDGQSLPDVAVACLSGLDKVIAEFRPDIVLVQGDTATACFGALAAFLRRTQVGHVEAGLRSGQKWAPYPEEMFRRVSDVLTDAYFAPTLEAREHLLRENVNPANVHVTGNTVVDALLEAAETHAPVADPLVREVLESDRPLVLLTAHRRESFGAPLERVFASVRELAATERVEVLFPVHPNPNVRESARAALGGQPHVHLVEPLDYFDLVQVLQRASLVLTDSGGIQEEAPTFGVPVLVLRDVTERPEGLRTGVVRLVGTDPELILAESRRALGGSLAGRRPMNPYGDGHAAERIADIVAHRLCGTPRETTDWDATPTVDVARLDALRRSLAGARA